MKEKALRSQLFLLSLGHIYPISPPFPTPPKPKTKHTCDVFTTHYVHCTNSSYIVQIPLEKKHIQHPKPLFPLLFFFVAQPLVKYQPRRHEDNMLHLDCRFL